MLKQLFSFLCLISMGTLSVGMEYKAEERAPLDTQINTSHDNSLDSKWELIIREADENKIISFLRYNDSFTEENFSELIITICQNDFKEVLEFMRTNYALDLPTKILCAAHLGKINKLKKTTNYSDFIIEDILDKEAFRNQLKLLRLPMNILDILIAHDGLNYLDTNKKRCLHSFIRDVNLPIILRFIKNSTSEQLNMVEESGNSALHEALYAFDAYHKRGQHIKANKTQSIIEALLKKGANPHLMNSKGVALEDFVFFKENTSLCKQWQTHHQTLPIKWNNLEKFDESGMSKKIAKKKRPETVKRSFTKILLIGISIIGIAFFCLGYKKFDKKISQISLKLK